MQFCFGITGVYCNYHVRILQLKSGIKMCVWKLVEFPFNGRFFFLKGCRTISISDPVV